MPAAGIPVIHTTAPVIASDPVQRDDDGDEWTSPTRARQPCPKLAAMRSRRLSDLRLDLIASPEVTVALREVCKVRTVTGQDSEDATTATDVLLVESAAAAHPDVVLQAVERIRRGAGSTALWLTRHEDVQDVTVQILDAFDVVFVTDSSAMRMIASRRTDRVSILPLGASIAPAGTGRADGDRVGYVGGFTGAWPEDARTLGEGLLDAATPYGLDIFARDDDELAGLPDRFKPRVHSEAKLTRSSKALQRCRALIVHLPRGTVPTVPRIALDALAIGVRVVMRSSDAWQILPPKLVTYVSTPAQGQHGLDWCMGSGEAQQERSQAGRAAICNAHTHAARLATIASTVGFTMVPEVGSG